MARLSLSFTLEMAGLTSDLKINGGLCLRAVSQASGLFPSSATLLLICLLGHEGFVKKKALEHPTDP